MVLELIPFQHEEINQKNPKLITHIHLCFTALNVSNVLTVGHFFFQSLKSKNIFTGFQMAQKYWFRHFLFGQALSHGMGYYKMNFIPEKNNRRGWLLQRHNMLNTKDNMQSVGFLLGGLYSVFGNTGLMKGMYFGSFWMFWFFFLNHNVFRKYGYENLNDYFNLSPDSKRFSDQLYQTIIY